MRSDNCLQCLFVGGIVKVCCCECRVCMFDDFKYLGCSMFVVILYTIDRLPVLGLSTPDCLLHLICFYSSCHISICSSMNVFLISLCDPVSIGFIQWLNILTEALLKICVILNILVLLALVHIC